MKKKVFVFASFYFILSNLFTANAQWSSTSPNIYNTNLGSVGIGTNSPSLKLTVDSKQTQSNSGFPASTGTIQNGIFRLQPSGNSWGEVFDFGMNVMPSYAWIQATNKNNLSYNYKLSINPNGGNVGIGISDPKTALDVNGEISLTGRIGFSLLDNFTYDNKNMGYYSLGWFADSQWNNTYGPSLWVSSFGGIKFFTTGSPRLTIDYLGRVGIGKTNPAYELEVNGTIHAKQVLVDMNNWSDFVFDKNYNLPSLSYVEDFISKNGHLPNIPSEDEVIRNGVNITEMQAKLLQKIEELTLYIIEQDNKIEKLQKRVNQE